MKKRFMGLTTAAVAGAVALAVAGCGGAPTATTGSDAGSASGSASADYKVKMVTDMGGVNDQSFNQLAWEGLQKLEKDTGIPTGYTESKQEADYATNLDKAVTMATTWCGASASPWPTPSRPLPSRTRTSTSPSSITPIPRTA